MVRLRLVSPHYHTQYSESIKVLDGTFVGSADDRSVRLGPGDEVSVPPRMVHSWGPVQEPVRMVLEIRPAHEGFEKWLTSS
ncbi:cupin domain-containing protein [Enteractinococcus coprophilus]|uniref:cupin domain-containing protein n=1 Tax=Enteractinococcus coprophilus TaxID=1027633 RepID=UPI001153C432